MALGKEISDFVNAFGATSRATMDFARAKYYLNGGHQRNPVSPDNFPTVKDAKEKYYQDYGKTAPTQPQQAIPTDTGGFDPSLAANDPGNFDYNQTYDDGGEVASPAAVPRKALDDQTRVAAYDPDLDAPPPPAQEPAPVVPAKQEAISVTPPGNAGTGGGFQPDAGGEGTSPNATHDYQDAIKGGLDYAQHIFHLNNEGAVPQASPHKEKGVKALAQGVGAATPQMVEAMDAKVNAGVPRDEAVWSIRRLEAIYRYYAGNGDTDKANKAAFELLQYSAGEAAKYGRAAMDDIKNGNAQGAIDNVVRGHAQIPDGKKLTVQGTTAHVVDARTGQTEQSFQFTPQQLFNAALGLSNRSMYWQVLAQRAGGAMKGQRTQTPAQEELTNARTTYIKARTERLARTPIKGAGGAGTNPAVDKLIDKIDQIDVSRGKKPDAREASTPPQPSSAGAGSDEDPDGAFTEAPPDLKDNPPAGANGPSPSTAPSSPSAGRPAAAPGGGPVTSTGNQPATDPDAVPDNEYMAVDADSNGKYRYVKPLQKEQPRPFDEEAPGPNPYTALRTEAARIPGKDGNRARQIIERKIKEYDADAKAYQGRLKDYTRTEQKRVDDEFKAANAERQAQAKAIYDRAPAGRDLDDLNGQINQTLQEIPQKYGDAAKGTIFGDAKVGDDQKAQLALELATSNPRTDGKRGLAMLQDLTRTMEKPNSRSYAVRGKDILGNVIVTTDNFGPIHIRPQAWKEISSIAKRRNLEAEAAKDKPQEPGIGDSVAKHGSAILNTIKKRLTPEKGMVQRPEGKTLIDDIREALPTGEGRGVPYARPGDAQRYMRAYPGMKADDGR